MPSESKSLPTILLTGTIFDDRPHPFTVTVEEMRVLSAIIGQFNRVARVIICPRNMSAADMRILCKAPAEQITPGQSPPETFATLIIDADTDINAEFGLTFRPDFSETHKVSAKSFPTICIVTGGDARIGDETQVSNENLPTAQMARLYLLVNGDRYAKCVSPANLNIYAPGPLYSDTVMDFGVMCLSVKRDSIYANYINFGLTSGTTLYVDVLCFKDRQYRAIHNRCGLISAMPSLDNITKVEINTRGCSRRLYQPFIDAAEAANIKDVRIIGEDAHVQALDTARKTMAPTRDVAEHIREILAAQNTRELKCSVDTVLELHKRFTSSASPLGKSINADIIRARYNLGRISWTNFMSYSIFPNAISFDSAKDAPIVCIHGENGAGKTAVIDALLMTIYMQNAKDNIRSFINTSANGFSISGTFERLDRSPTSGATVGRTFVVERDRTKTTGNDIITIFPPANARSREDVSDMYSAINALAHGSSIVPSDSIIHRSAAKVAENVGELCGYMDVALHTCISQQRYARDLIGDSVNSRRAIYERLFGITVLNEISKRVSQAVAILEKQVYEQMPCAESSAELRARQTELESQLDVCTREYNDLREKYENIKAGITSLLSSSGASANSPQSAAPPSPPVMDPACIKIAEKYKLTGATYQYVCQHVDEQIARGAILAPPADFDARKTRAKECAGRVKQLKDDVEAQLAAKKTLEDLTPKVREVVATTGPTEEETQNRKAALVKKYGFTNFAVFIDEVKRCKALADKLDESQRTLAADELELTELLTFLSKVMAYNEQHMLIAELKRFNDYDHMVKSRTRVTPDDDPKAAKISALIDAQDEIIAAMHDLTRRITTAKAEISVAEDKFARKEKYEREVGAASNSLNAMREYKRCFDGVFSVQVKIIRERMPAICAEINTYLTYMGVTFRATLEQTDSGLPNIMLIPYVSSTSSTSGVAISPQMASGFQYDTLNIALRVALWRQYQGAAPNFFIFDEPLAHADPANARRIIDFFRYVMSWPDAPQFILYTASDKSLAALSDRIISIKRDSRGQSKVCGDTYRASGDAPPDTERTTDSSAEQSTISSPSNAAETPAINTSAYDCIVNLEHGCYCKVCGVVIKQHTNIERHINSAGHQKRL